MRRPIAPPASRSAHLVTDGVVTTSELSRSGMAKRDIARAVATGSIRRIRAGWFAVGAVPSARLVAIERGGALGCVSGAAAHGLWSIPGDEIHVSYTHSGHRRRSTSGPHEELRTRAGARTDTSLHVIAHWNAPCRLDVSKGLLPMVDCLVEVFRCQSVDIGFAVLESALRQRRISPDQRRWIEQHVALRHRAAVRLADRFADSGTESLFRFRMSALGVMMRSQVPVPGVGRVDFAIGDRLVVEIDSTEHHAGRPQRLRDLRRDAILVGLGFIVLRFDYLQVLYDWETVVATVLSVIDRRDHLRR